MVTLLNTSILTDYGTFKYSPIGLDYARELVTTHPYQSAIGHSATAEILSELLGVPVSVNRIQYIQGDEVAIVFKLRGRTPEGKILTREEVEQIGYDFGLLQKI